jgi:predicted nucleic acid-binding protein
MRQVLPTLAGPSNGLDLGGGKGYPPIGLFLKIGVTFKGAYEDSLRFLATHNAIEDRVPRHSASALWSSRHYARGVRGGRLPRSAAGRFVSSLRGKLDRNQTSVRRPAALPAAQERLGLGIGEVSIVTLGLEVKADVLLMDDRKARRLAQQEGLTVLGCVGVLQDAFGLKLPPDLTQAYRELLVSGAYVDRIVLENILEILDLPPI